MYLYIVYHNLQNLTKSAYFATVNGRKLPLRRKEGLLGTLNPTLKEVHEYVAWTIHAVRYFQLGDLFMPRFEECSRVLESAIRRQLGLNETADLTLANPETVLGREAAVAFRALRDLLDRNGLTEERLRATSTRQVDPHNGPAHG